MMSVAITVGLMISPAITVVLSDLNSTNALSFTIRNWSLRQVDPMQDRRIKRLTSRAAVSRFPRLKNNVSIRPAISKTVDGCSVAPLTPRRKRPHKVKGRGGKVIMFHRLFPGNERYQLAFVQHENYVDETGDSFRGQGMSDTWFHRTQGTPPTIRLAVNGFNRFEFKQVGDFRARAIDRNIADFLGRLAATLQRHSHDVSLRLKIWRRGASGTAIIINGKRFHKGIDRIAICNRLVQGLQQHPSGPFTQHSATCARVEDVERRFAVQDATTAEHAQRGIGVKHAHAANDCAADLAALQSLNRNVHRHQG